MKFLHEVESKFYGKKRKESKQALYECPRCLRQIELGVFNVNKNKPIICKHCAIELSRKTHGLTKHPLYKVWDAMKDRCYREKSTRYEYYGGIGVSVCDEWKNDFKKFYDWAIDIWKPGLQIDKDILCKKLNIYPKIYSPETCLFVTPRENGMNSSHTILPDKEAKLIECELNNCKDIYGERDKIAKKHNISMTQLSNFISSSRMNIVNKGRGKAKKITDEQENEILRLRRERYQFKEIEKIIGVNWSTCRTSIRRFKENGGIV